jgi:hypothetical protein
MDTAGRDPRSSTPTPSCEQTDQSEFDMAWRDELVRGRIVAHAAPSPDHGIILANLATEPGSRLKDHRVCWPEVGSGAVPRHEQRDTARIPDAMIRRGKHPRVMVDVVSPSELHCKRDRDLRRSDLQAVAGVQEIAEIYQDEMRAHACRRQEAGWPFQSIAGAQAEIALPGVGIGVPLEALYLRVELAAPAGRPAATEP